MSMSPGGFALGVAVGLPGVDLAPSLGKVGSPSGPGKRKRPRRRWGRRGKSRAW